MIHQHRIILDINRSYGSVIVRRLAEKSDKQPYKQKIIISGNRFDKREEISIAMEYIPFINSM